MPDNLHDRIILLFLDNAQPENIIDGENICIKDVLKTLQPLPVAPLHLIVRRSDISSASVSLCKQRNFDYRKPFKATFEGQQQLMAEG